jgi:hypothetical protein
MVLEQKVSIGVVGLGSFGSRIIKILEKNNTFNIAFEETHSYKSAQKCDWVVVATPVLTHKEICHWFLENGSNVIVAKPCGINLDELVSLLDFAKISQQKFYVDDVFRYTNGFKQIERLLNNHSEVNEIRQISASWLKYGPFRDTINNALAYHHFCILSALSQGAEIEQIDVHLNQLNQKSFSARSGTIQLNSEIDRSSSQKSHKFQINESTLEILPNDKFLGLEKMILSAVNGSADFDLNKKIAISAQRATDALNAKKPKCAVIGGGVFGSVIATQMIDLGLETHLFESTDRLFSAASGINQYRLHRGYHYPRSMQTALEVKDESVSFLKKFPVSIKPKTSIYAIARLDSFLSADQYETFMREAGLEYETIADVLFTPGLIERVFSVNESLFDADQLRRLIEKELSRKSVIMHLSHPMREEELEAYDYSVIATYAKSNELLSSGEKRKYQFEVCEKPIVKLDEKFHRLSIVVMDGKFFCLDPLGQSELHVLGNVEHAIHSSNTGIEPNVANHLKKWLNQGVIPAHDIQKFTNFPKFEQQIREYLVEPGEITHIGSMFTVRTVLPRHEHDDARPTVISKLGRNKYAVLSGKIVAAVDTAATLSKTIEIS